MTENKMVRPPTSTWSGSGKSHDNTAECGTKTRIGIAGNLQKKRFPIRCVMKAEERMLYGE